MWLLKKKIKVKLGITLDQYQIERVESILKSLNAQKIDGFWDISGCSELSIVTFIIGKEKIIFCSESDEGVTIHGEEKLVNEFLTNFLKNFENLSLS